MMTGNVLVVVAWLGTGYRYLQDWLVHYWHWVWLPVVVKEEHGNGLFIDSKHCTMVMLQVSLHAYYQVQCDLHKYIQHILLFTLSSQLKLKLVHESGRDGRLRLRII